MKTPLGIDLGNSATAPDATVTVIRDSSNNLVLKDGIAGLILLSEILTGDSIISSLAAPDGTPNPALQVDNAGQIGIGGAPTEFLDLRGASATGIFLRIANATANEDTGLILAGDRTWRIENDGDASIDVADTFHIVDVTAGASRFSINIVGRVKVPGLLRVDGGILSLHSSLATILAQAVDADSSARFDLLNDAQRWLLKLDGADGDKFKLRDETGTKDVLTITTAGSLGLGVTPATLLHIQHATAGILRVESTGVNSTAQVELKNDAKTWVMRVDGTGSDTFVIRNETDSLDALTIDLTTGKLTLLGGTGLDAGILAKSTGADSVVNYELQNDVQHWIMKVDGAGSDEFKIRDETISADRLTIDSAGLITVKQNLKVDQDSVFDGTVSILDGSGAGGKKFTVIGANLILEPIAAESNLAFSIRGSGALRGSLRIYDVGNVNYLALDGLGFKIGTNLDADLMELATDSLTLNGDLTMATPGVVKGATCWIHAGRATVPQMNNTGEEMLVETIEMSDVKSFIMPQNGSVIWVSCAYDVTARTAGLQLNIGVGINNSQSFLSVVDDALATGKKAKATQARGITTFVAEDHVRPIMVEDGIQNVTVANVIMTMGVVFDA